MHIKYNNDGVKLINNNGNILNINWSEFWEICRQGRMIDAIGEVEEYLTMCDDINGVNANDILNDKKLIEEIADEMIDMRIGREIGADVWDATCKMIKNWR